ncbi:MAG: hypothetical protein KAU48_14420 [Candidatus Thorarchaeota archaeon]|nr:hypothetical protein [Candidatus Thorarchaeota archaeon]
MTESLHYEAFLLWDVSPRLAMSDLSKNSQCVLKILETADSLTTTEILEIARKKKYADICTDCAGGDAFVAAANQLVEMGLVTKKFGKGGYRWHLVKS